MGRGPSVPVTNLKGLVTRSSSDMLGRVYGRFHERRRGLEDSGRGGGLVEGLAGDGLTRRVRQKVRARKGEVALLRPMM